MPQGAAAPLSRCSLIHQLSDTSAVVAGQAGDAAAAVPLLCRPGSAASVSRLPPNRQQPQGELPAELSDTGSPAFLQLCIVELMPDNNQVCSAAHISAK